MKLTHTQFNVSLGKRLHAYRRAKGMSMDEVAKAAGVAKSTVHGTEHANTMPCAYILVKICEALEVDVGALIKQITYWDYSEDGKNILFPLKAEERKHGNKDHPQ